MNKRSSVSFSLQRGQGEDTCPSFNLGVGFCLLKTDQSASNNESIKLVLIGDGNIKKDLLDRYGAQDNIKFFDSKSKSHIVFYQKLFDLGYFCLDDKQLFDYGISPNKLYEYCYNAVP